MTIFGSHVAPHIPNIGYLEAYEGIWTYMQVYGCTWKYMEGMWMYMKVCGGIWKYIDVYGAI